jgi:hypothetical protein
MGLHVAIFYKIARNRALVEGNGVGCGGISSVTSGKSVVVAADFGKKGDPTRITQGMRESAEALGDGKTALLEAGHGADVMRTAMLHRESRQVRARVRDAVERLGYACERYCGRYRHGANAAFRA